MMKSCGYLQTQTYDYNISKQANHCRLKLQIKSLATAVDTCQ